MQQAAVGGLGTQNSSSVFGTLPRNGNIPIYSVSSNLGTTATGGGARQNIPTPAYNSKALAMHAPEESSLGH
jgi:hypothetical protein